MEAAWLPRTQSLALVWAARLRRLVWVGCFCCCLALCRAGRLSLLEAELCACIPYGRMGMQEY